jgi:hypothetical protein
MAKKIKKGERREKKGIFSRIGTFLSERSKGAQKATLVLFILILFAIISGIFGFYLTEPAKEIYISENQFIKETREIYDFEEGSEERTAQEGRAKDATEFYGSIMQKYTTSENEVVKAYATIHSNFIKALIALALVLPFVAIAIMFIGSPINFIFAVVNMVIVIPVKAIVYLFNSFRSERSEKKRIKHSSHQLNIEEAAN